MNIVIYLSGLNTAQRLTNTFPCKDSQTYITKVFYTVKTKNKDLKIVCQNKDL